jgi:SAM-dependent methyltransferase
MKLSVLSPSRPPTAGANQHLAIPLYARAVTAALNRTSDWWWERRLALRTTGRREVAFRDAERYEPVPYYLLARVFARLALGPADVFVDVGSGKGRVVAFAARLPLREVIGVEIEPELHQAAQENLARLRGRQAPVRLLCRSATEFDFRGVTAIGLFNPFNGPTMVAMLEAVRRSLVAQPRLVRIAYINAVCADVFAAQPWLQLTGAWEMSTWSRIKTPVYFYDATPPA